MTLLARTTARTCANEHCDNPPAFPETQLCDSCYGALLRTGRLPVIEAVFIPEWRRRDLARDLTGALKKPA